MAALKKAVSAVSGRRDVSDSRVAYVNFNNGGLNNEYYNTKLGRQTNCFFA